MPAEPLKRSTHVSPGAVPARSPQAQRPVAASGAPAQATPSAAGQDVWRAEPLPNALADLRRVAELVPAAGEALNALWARRPELFSKEDRILGTSFAEELRTHVENGFLQRREVDGFVSFLERLANRQFIFRESGYSHAGSLALMTLLNHPGLTLRLIQAARAGQRLPLTPQYRGDGLRSLPPLRDMEKGFRSVGWMNPVPAYERAFVHAVVDVLRPEVMPPGGTARRCDPVAVAMSKLTGEELRYSWAFNLQTGDDLVEALASQEGEGLCMADVEYWTRDGQHHFEHFPVFYGFDPQNRTVMVQAFHHGPKRISVDGLRFAAKGKTRPAVYYRASERMEPFLTRAQQEANGMSSLENARWGESRG